MNTNELMVTDLVYKKERDHYLPVGIIAIYEDNVDWKFGNTEGVISVNGIKPIPITAEILEANGFIKTGYLCRCVHNLADFDNHAQLDYNLKFSTFEIKRMKNRAWTAKIYMDAHYVHELQHALRLAGLDDLADSFVIEKGGKQ